MAKITDFFAPHLSVDEHGSPRVRRWKAQDDSSSHNAPSQPRQTFLDFGQASLSQVTCPECGMCYDGAFEEDIKRHTSFHQRTIQEKHVILLDAKIVPKTTIKYEGMTVMVFQATAIPDIIDRINLEEMQAAPIKELDRISAYLVVEGHETQVVAMALIEPVQEATLIESKGGGLKIDEAVPKTRVSIGVSRVWTHQQWRRKGLAARLLDCVRQHYVAPLKVSRRMLAFSQPTEAGFALAAAYQSAFFGGDRCLVYLCT